MDIHDQDIAPSVAHAIVTGTYAANRLLLCVTIRHEMFMTAFQSRLVEPIVHCLGVTLGVTHMYMSARVLPGSTQILDKL